MDLNPWSVESIQDFMFINCPECVYKTKDEHSFEDHAIQNHPQAHVLFNTDVKSEYVDGDNVVKEEPMDVIQDDYSEEKDFSLKNEVNETYAPESYMSIEEWIKEVEKKAIETDDFSCKFCDKNFRRAAYLNKHLRSYKKCDICAIVFCGAQAKRNYNSHQKDHQPKTYSCNVCNITFDFKCYLKRHLKKSKKCSQSTKPIECPYCHIFFENHVLEEHFKICGPKYSKKNYQRGPLQCYFCGLVSENVEDHIQSVHEIKEELIKTSGFYGPLANFQCEKCSVCFDIKSTFDYHICGVTTPYLLYAHKLKSNEILTFPQISKLSISKEKISMLINFEEPKLQL